MRHSALYASKTCASDVGRSPLGDKVKRRFLSMKRSMVNAAWKDSKPPLEYFRRGTEEARVSNVHMQHDLLSFISRGIPLFQQFRYLGLRCLEVKFKSRISSKFYEPSTYKSARSAIEACNPFQRLSIGSPQRDELVKRCLKVESVGCSALNQRGHDLVPIISGNFLVGCYPSY